MRPITNFTLHAILAAALATLAASGAASGPVVSGELFVRLPAGAHGKGEQIEIQSYQWGSPQAGRVSKVDGFTVKQGVKPADPGQYGEWIADVERSQGSGGGVTLKGSKIGENAPRPKPSDVTLKRGTSGSANTGGVRVASGDIDGAPVGANETLTVGSSQTESQATGKRQHRPLAAQNYYDQSPAEPLLSGSVRVKVKFPWLSCKVGARYPTLQLGGATGNYVLQDVTVASCGGTGSTSTEEVAFYYNRIAFNYASTSDKP